MNTELVNSIHHVLVSKLANTRINEYLNAKVERDLKTQNKVADADNNLLQFSVCLFVRCIFDSDSLASSKVNDMCPRLKLAVLECIIWYSTPVVM